MRENIRLIDCSVSPRRHNIFCDNAAVGADDPGQPYDVIAAARADVGDSHPGFDAKQTHELAWFASCVALLFSMPNRANNIRNWAIGIRKRNSRRARIPINSCAEPDT